MYRRFLNFIRRLWSHGKTLPVLDRAAFVTGIKNEQALLHSAMEAADNGFLTLGQQMQSMSKMADNIARLASEVLNSTSGTGDNGTLCQATRTFEKVFKRAESKLSHYTTILERLRDIGGRTTAILAVRSELSRALFTFRPLAMGLRVETTRLGQDEAKRFLDLAESITVAQAQALQSVDRCFAELADMLGFIESMRLRLKEYSDELGRELAGTRRGLDEHLSALKERWSHAADAGAAADAAVGNIVAQIGKIVVATQYQDITHQQIEHISSALAEISQACNEAGNARHKSETELAGFAYHAGLVQCQQMDVVAGEVDKAGKTIVDGMKRIMDSAGSLARCDRTTDSSDDDLVEAFRNDIQSMTAPDEAGSGISEELAAGIEPAVKMLSEFAADMRRYSVQIRLAAINAQVHACRAHDGEVLEVLASRLRIVADTSLGIIDEMSRVLVDIIRDLNGDLSQSRIAAIEEGNALRQETGRVMSLLEQVQTDVRCKVVELSSLYKKLTEDTQATLAKTDLQESVVSRVLKAKSDARALVDSVGLGEEPESDATVRNRIAALRRGYTMATERETHDVVAKSLQGRPQVVPVPEPIKYDDGDKAAVLTVLAVPVATETRDTEVIAAADAPIVASATEVLGDNVELF